MADRTKAAGSTWKLAQNLANCQEPAVDLDVSDDYKLFDNQVEVDLTQETRDLARDGKVVITSQRVVHLCHARLYQINFRDLLNNLPSAHVKVGDVRAELSVKELDGITPQTGDKLVAPSGTYFLYAADFDHTAQMHIVWCRK